MSVCLSPSLSVSVCLCVSVSLSVSGLGVSVCLSDAKSRVGQLVQELAVVYIRRCAFFLLLIFVLFVFSLLLSYDGRCYNYVFAGLLTS